LVGFISPPDFNLAVSIFLVSVIVVGGLASIPGTLVGAVFLTLFFQRLSGWRDLRSVIYGLGLILVVIFLPGGLWRGGQRIYSLWGRIHPGDRARDSATLSPPDPLPHKGGGGYVV
jgi:branched-chain amino acid transport system permease protein